MRHASAVMVGAMLVAIATTDALVLPGIAQAQVRDTTSARRPLPAQPQSARRAPVARGTPLRSAPALAPYPRPWIGLAFSCSDCRYVSDDSLQASRWSFPGPVEIYSVEEGSPAHAAGIRRGDALTHVAGHAIATAEAGRRWASLQAGDTVRVTYRRGGTSIVTTLHPAEPRSARTAFVAASAPAHASALRSTAVLRDSVLSLARRQEQNLARHQREQQELLLKLAERTATAEERRALDQALQSAHAQQRAELRRYIQETQLLQAQTQRVLGAVTLTPTPAPAPARPVPPPQLRYSGTFAGADVEVRGSSSVVVTESGGELIITTQDATVRLRVPPRN